MKLQTSRRTSNNQTPSQSRVQPQPLCSVKNEAVVRDAFSFSVLIIVPVCIWFSGIVWGSASKTPSPALFESAAYGLWKLQASAIPLLLAWASCNSRLYDQFLAAMLLILLPLPLITLSWLAGTVSLSLIFDAVASLIFVSAVTLLMFSAIFRVLKDPSTAIQCSIAFAVGFATLIFNGTIDLLFWVT